MEEKIINNIDKLDGMTKIKGKCGYEIIGGCSDLRRLKQEKEELCKLIRGTKDYTEVCSVCKDEVTIYPNISGRTDYTQNEVECRTLAQIITRKNNLEQENEKLNEELKIQKDISSSHLELYKIFSKTVLHNQGFLNSIPITEEEEFYLSHTNEQAEQIKYFINKYKHALEKIKAELKDDLTCESRECGCDDYGECLECLKETILNITTEAIGK